MNDKRVSRRVMLIAALVLLSVLAYGLLSPLPELSLQTGTILLH